MTPSTTRADLIRRVECLEGRVEVNCDLRIRFDYARATPWIRRIERADNGPALLSLAGPEGLKITGPLLDRVPADPEISDQEEGDTMPRLAGSFPLSQGQDVTWDLTWFPSYEAPPEPVDADEALRGTVAFWTDWSSQLTVHDHDPLAARSLLVLRALTHADTGGIVAAPTTSLPEEFGGSRNWDYRYTWLRDAALTIEVTVAHGLTEGPTLWRNWLLRAVAGDADNIQIMYGLAGERDLRESELPHLAGYERSRPVRIGNEAAKQYQADVVGEVMLALAALRDAGVKETKYSWGLQKNLLRYCEANLDRKDHGIWEMRGDPHFFTHGRAMIWAAFNEGIRALEVYGLPGPIERWRALREQLRVEIDEHGFATTLNTFTQTYDNTEVDASLLHLPHTKFVAYDDPRMLGTVARIEQELEDETGLVHRYRTGAKLDGLTGDEYPFLLCSFWLVEQYARSGRVVDARRLMDRLCNCATDLGLLSEEYDPGTGRLAGNFPQAFSHLGLIRAADAIAEAQSAP
jgi:GH15 family glucan-1,4-alpha-glucosidase